MWARDPCTIYTKARVSTRTHTHRHTNKGTGERGFRRVADDEIPKFQNLLPVCVCMGGVWWVTDPLRPECRRAWRPRPIHCPARNSPPGPGRLDRCRAGAGRAGPLSSPGWLFCLRARAAPLPFDPAGFGPADRTLSLLVHVGPIQLCFIAALSRRRRRIRPRQRRRSRPRPPPPPPARRSARAAGLPDEFATRRGSAATLFFPPSRPGPGRVGGVHGPGRVACWVSWSRCSAGPRRRGSLPAPRGHGAMRSRRSWGGSGAQRGPERAAATRPD